MRSHLSAGEWCPNKAFGQAFRAADHAKERSRTAACGSPGRSIRARSSLHRLSEDGRPARLIKRLPLSVSTRRRAATDRWRWTPRAAYPAWDDDSVAGDGLG